MLALSPHARPTHLQDDAMRRRPGSHLWEALQLCGVKVLGDLPCAKGHARSLEGGLDTKVKVCRDDRAHAP
jgi:hypothetical protein